MTDSRDADSRFLTIGYKLYDTLFSADERRTTEDGCTRTRADALKPIGAGVFSPGDVSTTRSIQTVPVHERLAGDLGSLHGPVRLCPFSSGAAVTTFIAEDYAFTGPEQLESGWQRVRLINRGRDVHQSSVPGPAPGKNPGRCRTGVGCPDRQACRIGCGVMGE
jgi:hypothetical protein